MILGFQFSLEGVRVKKFAGDGGKIQKELSMLSGF